MNNIPRIMLIFFSALLLLLTSCQQNNFSEALIEELRFLNSRLEQDNQLIEASTKKVLSSMINSAKTNRFFKPMLHKAQQIDSIIQVFDRSIKDIKALVIQQSGDLYTLTEAQALQAPNLVGIPKNIENKSLVQQLFLEGYYDNKQQTPLGKVIDEQLQISEKKVVELLEQTWEDGGIKGTIFADPKKKRIAMKNVKEELIFNSSSHYQPTQHQGKTWVSYTFGGRTLIEALSMLQAIQNDIAHTKYAVINFFAGQFYRGCTYDKFDVFAHTTKQTIRLGDTYEANIALGDYSAETILAITVNGDSLNFDHGQATYQVCPSSIGEQRYTVEVTTNNNLSGKAERYYEQFYFEVTQ